MSRDGLKTQCIRKSVILTRIMFVWLNSVKEVYVYVYIFYHDRGISKT